MKMKRFFLAAAAAAAAALLWLPAAPVQAADAGAKAFLEEIYKPYSAPQTANAVKEPEADEKAADARRYAPELVELLARDREESRARDEVGRLDFDPLTNAQDWEATAVAIQVEDAGAGKARGQASFKMGDRPVVVRFDLVKTAAGWRIADIHWDGAKEGLKDILSAPAR